MSLVTIAFVASSSLAITAFSGSTVLELVRHHCLWIIHFQASGIDLYFVQPFFITIKLINSNQTSVNFSLFFG
jgi:stage V sporulation protein SpoVS